MNAEPMAVMIGRDQEWPTALDEVLAGLPRDARVVICAKSGPILADIVLACLDQGLVAVPLEPRTSDARLASIATRVSASLVIDGRAGRLVLTTDPAAEKITDPAATGLAFIIFTSGSTGQPKGVMLGRECVTGNAMKVAQLLGISPDRPHATCLPFYHVNALVMSLVGTKVTGTPLSVCARFQPDEYFRRIGEANAATASIVPALLERIVAARPPWPDSLEFLVTAAAPLSSDLAGRFYRLYGPRLRQGYGLSEAVNFSFMMPLVEGSRFLDLYVNDHPPVGIALPDTDLILDDGEVLIRTPDMMRGYWKDPAATAETVSADGWLRTGDLGELRDGLLVLRARRTEVINRGGEKFFPLDIEDQWRAAGMTGSFAAVAVAGGDLGQDVGLICDDGETLTQLEKLPTAHVQSPIAARADGLLVTATGKPRRSAMGLRLRALRENPDRYQELVHYAHRAASSLAASEHRPTNARAARLHAQARYLAVARLPDVTPAWASRSAAHDAIDAVVAHWPELASGSSGSAIMRRHPGLWRRLMVEWPMGSYAGLACEVLQANDWLNGPVLEIGSGVGNTTSLIAPLVTGGFVWSDQSADLVHRGTWPGRGVVLDFDHDPPPGLGGFTTIVGTNALHCAADKARSLRMLRSLLAPGGILVLAEGGSPTTPDGMPWALDFLFCAFDGWWDRSGFLTRHEWLSLLEQAGFHRLGFGVLRAGAYDLGGVVWGARDDRPTGKDQACIG